MSACDNQGPDKETEKQEIKEEAVVMEEPKETYDVGLHCYPKKINSKEVAESYGLEIMRGRNGLSFLSDDANFFIFINKPNKKIKIVRIHYLPGAVEQVLNLDISSDFKNYEWRGAEVKEEYWVPDNYRSTIPQSGYFQLNRESLLMARSRDSYGVTYYRFHQCKIGSIDEVEALLKQSNEQAIMDLKKLRNKQEAERKQKREEEDKKSKI